VHISPWPSTELIGFSDNSLLKPAAASLILIRKAKSDAKLSMKAEIKTAKLSGPKNQLDKLAKDLRAAGKIQELIVIEAPEISLSDLEFVLEG
jgi:valyl-tRNA synthetase